MTLQSISSVSEYKAALKRVDELWDALPDTPKAEELDELVEQITAYEEVTFPMTAPASKT